MLKKLLILIIFSSVFFVPSVFADELRPGRYCSQKGGDDCCNSDSGPCVVDGTYKCLPNPEVKYEDGSSALQCQKATVENTFGQIKAPGPLAAFLQKDPTGAGAISNFLSNLVRLIFTLATIVFVFMILWGAFDWLISEGDKEKLASAQKKIINAVIGIMLFSIAFALINIFGGFTGFTFFK